VLGPMPCCFESERLHLRCYRPGDGGWYYAMALRNRAHLSRYESGNAANSLNSEAEAEALLLRFAEDWRAGARYFVGAFAREDGAFAAQIYVGLANPDLPEYEFGYIADCDHVGRGFVTEAGLATLALVFAHLGAHRVSADCDDGNRRSARVLERCGFTQEGHVREDHRWPDGTITGTLHYGLLRREFEARRP
jgi:[ribosomal protein S5]-alanine N-acetyltransferase